jgi:hypothetical protein
VNSPSSTELFVFHNRIPRIANGAIVAAMAFAISCGDLSTAARRTSASSDFVAKGKVDSRLWLPAKGGQRLASKTSLDITVSNVGGEAQARPGQVTLAVTDSAAAQHLGLTRLDAPAAMPEASVEKMFLKARYAGTRTIDGKRIERYVVRDDDRASSRPPKTVLILVDGQLAAFTDYVWRRREGAWRLLKSHTSFVDGRGTLTMAYDVDAAALEYRAASPSAALPRGLRQAAGLALASVERLVQPDVLYAASVEEVCVQEGLKALAAGAAVVAAGALVEAARITFNAATEALTLGLAACTFVEITCPDLAPLIAAEGAAAAILKQAMAALTAAILLAASADLDLAECQKRWQERQLKPESVTGPSENESNCAGDEEEWCEWILSWPDGILQVKRSVCWCQAGDYAT